MINEIKKEWFKTPNTPNIWQRLVAIFKPTKSFISCDWAAKGEDFTIETSYKKVGDEYIIKGFRKLEDGENLNPYKH